MTRILPTSLALLITLAGAVSGQQLDADNDRFRDARANVHLIGLEMVPPAPLPVEDHARATQTPGDDDSGGISFREIAHTIGGALVGGWLGYVGAQVVRSDWDKEINGSFTDQRTAWVAGGALVGILGSRLIGSTTSPRPGSLEMEPSRRDRNQNEIRFEAIRSSGLQNAYDLIHSLRREWLIPRGVNSWAETPQGTAEGFGATYEADIKPGRDMIIVYVDDIRLGGVQEMEEIPTDILTRAEFIDSRRATYLYGSGHAHGVIRLSTEMPPR